MYALNLLETEWHVELDVGGSISIVSQLIMIMEAIVFCSEAEILMPLHAGLFPFSKPIELSTRLNEELHLHLLKLAHTENELSCHDFVTECLTNLRDTERNLHASSLLNIKIIDEDTLCSLRTKVNLHRAFCACSHLGGEHKVELAHVSPVLCARDWAYDFLVEDNLLQCFKVWTLHCVVIATMEIIVFLLVFEDARVSLAELSLIESVTKLLLCFSYFLSYLVLIFAHLVFDEHIGTVALL